MGLFGKKDINKEDHSLELDQEPDEKKRPSIFGKAKSALVNAVDQNADGSLDMKDVALLAGSMGSAAKKAASNAKLGAVQGGDKLGNWMDQAKREKELKALKPIFEEDLESPEFSISKLIRIAEMDKKHAESEYCKGSIGFWSIGFLPERKEWKVLNIYTDKADMFGLTYYPDRNGEIYYVDPFDRDHYIALDDYFHYLKVARVNELQRIAQDLGAKHFRVTYKENKKSEMEKHQKGKLAGAHKAAGASGTTEAESDYSERNSSTLEIAAEMECIGHDPVEPKLVYFQKDDSIKNLIRLRMSDNTVKHQKFTLSCSESSGIRMNDAAKIDAALQAMKCSVSASISSKLQSEARRYFEYEIDF